MAARNGNYVVAHKELVGTVTNGAVTGFSVTTASRANPGYDLNPSITSVFPWLSRVAKNFEMFKFLELTFDLVPANPTSSTGIITASLDYDWDDPVPLTKQELYGKACRVSGPVWQPLSLRANVADMHRDMPFKYCSENAKGNQVEPRTSYCGFMTIGVDTPTANLTWDLWVNYRVEFKMPELTQTQLFDTEGANMMTVANVSDNSGPGFWRVAGSSIPDPASPIREVTPGVGCPQMAEAGKNFSTAWDLRAIQRGLMTAVAQYTETGSSPSAMIAKLPKWAGKCYDQNGLLLGECPVLQQAVGSHNPADWTTVGLAVRSMALLSIEAIRTAFPTMRYLVPFLAASAAIGPGSVRSGYKLEL